MNWIKNNLFLATIIGITISISAILSILALKWKSQYDEIKLSFDETLQAVKSSERMTLYPTAENREEKKKALLDYHKNVMEMTNLFKAYRLESHKSITPQEFTDQLKSAEKKLSAKFAESGCKIPEDFFLGFEVYRNKLAESGATQILSYQAKNLEQILQALVSAEPTALLKITRESAPEELGQFYQSPPNTLVRHFPFEITFKGSEVSVRKFLNALGSKESYYSIVRCIKIQNENNNPPNIKDAKFDTAPKEKIPNSEDALFEGGNPNESEESKDENTLSPDEQVSQIDVSRILSQVLGNEDLSVFIRFDIITFLSSKELPKP